MSKIFIQPKLIGHMWDSADPTLPRIISVVKSVCEAGYVGKGGSYTWLLDYTFTSFGRYRVKGDETRAWKERRAFEGHLYPVGGFKWEDTTTAGVPYTQSIFITFVGGETAGLPQLFRGRPFARFKDPSRRLARVLERMLQTGLDLGDGGFWNAQSVLCEIIALLLGARHVEENTYVVPETEASTNVSEFVQSARLYLQDRLSERVTRKDMAEHLNMSVSALSHRYRSEAGESPMTTLARMRINLTKSLLSRGYVLKTIAAQTGFCDEFHLSKTFKRMEGISPQQYRRTESRGS